MEGEKGGREGEWGEKRITQFKKKWQKKSLKGKGNLYIGKVSYCVLSLSVSAEW